MVGHHLSTGFPQHPPQKHPVKAHKLALAPAPAQQQNKDSCFTYVHMHRAGDADLFEDFCRDRLPDDDIYVPAQHQPVNPEDEDDVVPDQHAAFGIQRATQQAKEPAWKDLGLAALMDKGPGPAAGAGGGRSGSGAGASGNGSKSTAASRANLAGRRMPR